MRTRELKVTALMVSPSGCAVESATAAIVPAPPTLFSITTGWLLRYLLTSSANFLAGRSVTPPAAKPTSIVIGFVGYSWVRPVAIKEVDKVTQMMEIIRMTRVFIKTSYFEKVF
jgi:hypothetical protein